MGDSSVRDLSVEVAIGNADAVELDRVTASLRRELLYLDVDSVERLHEGPPPPGARAVDLVALGALVVKVGEAAGALRSVVRTVQGWLARKPDGRVRLKIDGDEIEVSGATAAQQQELIEAWLARHRSG
jgi:hypothetical protein